MIILIVALAVASSAFAWGMNDGHQQYRGRENSPYTNLRRLNIDPNMAMRLNRRDFEEYMRRAREIQRYHDATIRNNRAAAAAERAWTSRQNRDSFAYQLERSLGRAVSDVIGGAARGSSQRINREIRGGRR